MTTRGSGIIVLVSTSATFHGIFLYKVISSKQDKYSTLETGVSESEFDNLIPRNMLKEQYPNLAHNYSKISQ
jgi:hypothetical protein